MARVVATAPEAKHQLDGRQGAAPRTLAEAALAYAELDPALVRWAGADDWLAPVVVDGRS